MHSRAAGLANSRHDIVDRRVMVLEYNDCRSERRREREREKS